MKNNIYFYVALTTLMLVMVTIMATINFPYSWIFYLTVIGQALVVIMVYKVLKDNYSTDKTFKDFYEDHPIEQQEHYR